MALVWMTASTASMIPTEGARKYDALALVPGVLAQGTANREVVDSL
jgi:hypothetical protein